MNQPCARLLHLLLDVRKEVPLKGSFLHFVCGVVESSIRIVAALDNTS